MKKISNYVEEYIKENIFIEESLSKGLINISALSEYFQPRLEKELGREIKFTTINMAIRRFAENHEKFNKKDERHIFYEDFVVRSNLIDVTIYKSEEYSNQIKKLSELINSKDGDYLTITEGRNEITILTNKKYLQELITIFGNEKIKLILDSVGCIQIKLNEISIQEVGVFYKVIKSLTWEGINILELVSTYTELILIISEDELSRAYEIVRKIEKK